MILEKDAWNDSCQVLLCHISELQLFHPSVYQHSAESICFDTERRCKTDVARQVAMTTCVKRRGKDGLVRLCYVLPLRKDNSPRVKF